MPTMQAVTLIIQTRHPYRKTLQLFRLQSFYARCVHHNEKGCLVLVKISTLHSSLLLTRSAHAARIWLNIL